MKPTAQPIPGRWVPLRRAGPSLRPPVAWQAVQQWIAAGFSGYRRVGDRVLVNLDALERWREKFRTDPDEPGHGGRRRRVTDDPPPPPTPPPPRRDERAMRRSASNAVEIAARDPAQGVLFDARPLPLTERQLLARAEAGDLTQAELRQSLDALEIIERIRANARESGRLLDAEDVEREATAHAIAIRARLDMIPARAEKRAVVELGIAARDAARLRDILLDEVHAACLSLSAADPPPAAVETARDANPRPRSTRASGVAPSRSANASASPPGPSDTAS